MTTNKPGVKRYELESGYDSMMRRVNRMQESEGGVYVRFDDYEALKAECEKLMEALELARRTLAMAALEGEVSRRIDSALAAYRKQQEQERWDNLLPNRSDGND